MAHNFHDFSEKLDPVIRSSTATKLCKFVIVLCQHVLLWMSLYVCASTIFLLIQHAVVGTDITYVALALAASTVTILQICLHETTARRQWYALDWRQNARADNWRRFTLHILRLEVMLWMAAVGLGIAFTAAQHPLCAANASSSDVPRLDIGNICIIHRVGIISDMVALVACGLLLILTNSIHDSLYPTLIPIRRTRSSPPLSVTSSRTKLQPAFSEMSFKCRSSADLIPYTTTTPATKPTIFTRAVDQAHAHRSALTALPSPVMPTIRTQSSLRSLRSNATLSLPPPPSSPLPPLPAHIPDRYRVCRSAQWHARGGSPYAASALNTHSHPSLPTTTAAGANAAGDRAGFLAVAAQPRRATSLSSSIYSRDVGGDWDDIERDIGSGVGVRPAARNRSTSAESVVTVRAGTGSVPEFHVRRPSEDDEDDNERDIWGNGDEQDDDFTPRCSIETDVSSDIDDARALQARLPGMRGALRDRDGVSVPPLVITKSRNVMI